MLKFPVLYFYGKKRKMKTLKRKGLKGPLLWLSTSIKKNSNFFPVVIENCLMFTELCTKVFTPFKIPPFL